MKITKSHQLDFAQSTTLYLSQLTLLDSVFTFIWENPALGFNGPVASAMSCVSTLPLRESRRPHRHESVFHLKATMLSFIKQTACVSFIYHVLHIFFEPHTVNLFLLRLFSLCFCVFGFWKVFTRQMR